MARRKLEISEGGDKWEIMFKLNAQQDRIEEMDGRAIYSLN